MMAEYYVEALAYKARSVDSFNYISFLKVHTCCPMTVYMPFKLFIYSLAYRTGRVRFKQPPMIEQAVQFYYQQ